MLQTTGNQLYVWRRVMPPSKIIMRDDFLVFDQTLTRPVTSNISFSSSVLIASRQIHIIIYISSGVGITSTCGCPSTHKSSWAPTRAPEHLQKYVLQSCQAECDQKLKIVAIECSLNKPIAVSATSVCYTNWPPIFFCNACAFQFIENTFGKICQMLLFWNWSGDG